MFHAHSTSLSCRFSVFYPYRCMWQVTFSDSDFLDTAAVLPWHLAVPGQRSFRVELAASILAGSD